MHDVPMVLNIYMDSVIKFEAKVMEAGSSLIWDGKKLEGVNRLVC